MAESQNTALTENDKLHAARREDFEANLEATSDVDASERTASHVAVLPSDVDSFALTHDLTTHEGALALERIQDRDNEDEVNTVVSDLKAGRTVFREAWVEGPAGVADPFDRSAVPAPPVPPAIETLDPHAPRGDEPTGHVLNSDSAADAVAQAEAFADASQEVADKVTALAEEKAATAEPVTVPDVHGESTRSGGGSTPAGDGGTAEPEGGYPSELDDPDAETTPANAEDAQN